MTGEQRKEGDVHPFHAPLRARQRPIRRVPLEQPENVVILREEIYTLGFLTFRGRPVLVGGLRVRPTILRTEFIPLSTVPESA